MILEVSDHEFRLWQHSPISKAFFQFLEDTVALYRENAADLVESGAFRLQSPAEHANPDVIRGRIAALRELREITVQSIQGFYGKETPSS